MLQLQDKYSESRIDALKRYLEREAANGRPRDYEIMIDGFKVIPRTNNLDEFHNYEIEMRDDTRNVTFLVYDGPTTPRNTKYTFRLDPQPDLSLSGTEALGEINRIVQQKLDEKDKDVRIERLQEKLEDTEKKLEDAEQYQEQLEAEIETLKANKYNLSGFNLGEFGSVILEHLIKRHGSKIPGGLALAGFLDTPLPTQQQPSQAEGVASFQKQEEVPEFSEDQILLLKNWQLLEKQLNREQMLLLNGILSIFCQQPAQVETVADLLNIKIKKT